MLVVSTGLELAEDTLGVEHNLAEDILEVAAEDSQLVAAVDSQLVAAVGNPEEAAMDNPEVVAEDIQEVAADTLADFEVQQEGPAIHSKAVPCFRLE